MKNGTKRIVLLLLLIISLSFPNVIKAAKELNCTYKDNVTLSQNTSGTITITNKKTEVESTEIKILELENCPEKLYYQASESYCSGEIGWRTYSTASGRCQNTSYQLDENQSTKIEYPALECKYNNDSIILSQNINGQVTIKNNGNNIDKSDFDIENLYACPLTLFHKTSNSSYCGSSYEWFSATNVDYRCGATSYELNGKTYNPGEYPELECKYNGDSIILSQDVSGNIVITNNGNNINEQNIDTEKLYSCPLYLVHKTSNNSYCGSSYEWSYRNSGLDSRCDAKVFIRNGDKENDYDNNQNDSNNNQNGYADEIKNFFLGKTTCGGITNFTFPDMLPGITSLLYNILKIAVPVILVIKGMMDMFKATTAGKEDEMKKAQKKFVQRLIAGACALLAFIIVETVINFIADKTENSGAMDCVNCFINNKCQKN